MRSIGFLPSIIKNTDEFYGERASLLMRRAIVGLALAIACNVAMITFLYLQDVFEIWFIAVFCLPLYVFPLHTSYRFIVDKPDQLSDQKKKIRRYMRQLAIVILVWNCSAAFILPILEGDIRLITISLFIVSVLAYFLPLTLLPRYALFILAISLFPMSLQLALLGDDKIMSLGLAGMVLVFMEVMQIVWLYRTEMDNFRREHYRGKISEPDMSESGLKQLRISAMYFQGAQSIILQAATAFILVIALRTETTEALMWNWFLGFISVQVLRAASIVSFMDDSEKRTLMQWRLIFSGGVLVSQIAWFSYLFIFSEMLNGFNYSMVSGILILMAVFSTIGLTADRALLYFNSVLCLAPLTLILIADLNTWLVVALSLLAILSLLVVVENIHQSSARSLKGRLLQKLAEYRAEKMQELNIDLTHARKRLTEVNASLESQIQERTRELKHQANHDMLTGLGNRYRFATEVQTALEEYDKDQSGFAVYMLDLNRFKEINDGLGHFSGDHVLRETAQRISQACDENRICARWGGDEFVILQKRVSSRDDIQRFSERLIKQLQVPIELEKGPVTVGASIGVSICPDHGVAADELLEHADIAVYRAKCMKDGVSIYNDHWGSEAAERVRLAQALRKAIETRSMDVALQPFIAAKSGSITGFEALARWPQQNGDSISPGVFIPLAEEYGFMPLLGGWILRRACEILVEIAPDSMIRVAVNISVLQLIDPDFVTEVFTILEETGLQPERLEVEMTENVFANDVEQIRHVLNQLRARGIRVSIDDFGTGYSSISYLRNFPLDSLKIDRSFVTALKDGGEGLYSSIVALAHGLELSIIVEGVETEEELKAVLRLGGEELQGYYFAKPMLRQELDAWYLIHNETPYKMPRQYPPIRLA